MTVRILTITTKQDDIDAIVVGELTNKMKTLLRSIAGRGDAIPLEEKIEAIQKLTSYLFVIGEFMTESDFEQFNAEISDYASKVGNEARSENQ